MFAYLKTRTLLISLSLLLVGSVLADTGRAQTIDFGKMDVEKESSRNISKLLTETQQLWEGQTENLQIETGMLDGKLLVLTATNQRLRVNLGNELDLLEGEVSRRIPGKILLLDSHSLPNRSGRALVTVTFLTGDEFRTTVLVVSREAGEINLQKFDSKPWKMIRPVGDRMFSQTFDPNKLWQNDISFLRTTRTGYVNDRETDLPEGIRLTSLARLSDERWVGTNGNGNLVLLEGGKILSTVEGDFGAPSHVLKPLNNSWRRGDQGEPVRITPEVIEGEELLVVMENPPVQTGLQGFLSPGSDPSTLKFFSYGDNELTERSMVGPFEGRVLDVEVPPANPNQLLWLRKLSEERVVLEMLDLSRL